MEDHRVCQQTADGRAWKAYFERWERQMTGHFTLMLVGQVWPHEQQARRFPTRPSLLLMISFLFDDSSRDDA
jgi:hypothetical protein